VKIIYITKLLSLIFFISTGWGQSYFILTDAPSTISIPLERSIESNVLSDKKIKKLSLEEKRICLENDNCMDKIIEKFPKSSILKIDYFETIFSKEVFFTVINLSTKTIEISNHVECIECSSIDLLKKVSSHKLSNLNAASYSLQNNSYKFKYKEENFVIQENLIPIILTTNPPSNVFIKNRLIGKSPLEISGKKNQKIQIQFIDINYKKLSKSITFKKPKSLNYDLLPIITSLSLTSRPKRAKIYINNKSNGYTPKVIKNIKLTDVLNIRLELENYIPQEFIFQPKSESIEKASVDLERGIGFLRVRHDSSSSDNIEVFVNGRFTGRLSKFNNDTLTLNAGFNGIILKEGSVERKGDYKITMDEFTDWEVSFVDSVEISISF